MASDRRPEPEWDAGSGPPPGRGGPNPVPTGSGRHPGGGHLPMSSGTAASGRRRGRPAAARRAAGATGTLPRPGESADGTEPVPAGRRWPWRTLLAALGGGVLVLAFPATDLPALAVLGPAALALAVRRQRFRSGLWLGLVFGLAFFVPLLSWTGVYVGPFPWLALAVWEALHLALLGGATAVTSRLRLWPLWAATLWVADEALRGRFVLGGFPWGRLGFSQTRGPLLSLAGHGGVPLVTFAVALTGTLLAWAGSALVRTWRSRSDTGERGPAVRRAVLAVAAVLVVPLAGSLAWLPLPGPSLTAG